MKLCFQLSLILTAFCLVAADSQDHIGPSTVVLNEVRQGGMTFATPEQANAYAKVAAAGEGLRQNARGEFTSLFAQSRRFGDEEMECLKYFPDLERLMLNQSGITDAGLPHLLSLTKIWHLAVADTRITDEGLAIVGRLTKLRHLDLHSNKITAEGLKKLGKLDRLESLSLGGTGIGDAGMPLVAAHKELRYVYLDDSVTKAGLLALTGLKKIEAIRAGEFGDEELATLSSFPLLEGVGSLQRITDAGMPSLSRLANLRTIDLNGAPITDAGAKYLQFLTKAQCVRLNDTKITDAAISEQKTGHH